MSALIQRLGDHRYRIPALIDAHVHIESSHLTPARFGALLAAQGTLDAIADPHEIANVAGERGLKFMLADARRSPARIHYALPSCVPATPFETSGAELTAADTRRLFAEHPEFIALGEMMNFPGVIADDPDVLAKIAAAASAGKPVDGHFPGAHGADLVTYAAHGITSDHETLTAEEALEKTAAGMLVAIREGSAAKNLAALLPAVGDDNWRQFAFCTDDCSAADLLGGSGGILACIRQAVRLGMDPERAVALGAVNARRHYDLKPDDGDYLVVRDLDDFKLLDVFKGGRSILAEARAAAETADPAPSFAKSVRLPPLADGMFEPTADAAGMFDVIGVSSGTIITEHLRCTAADTAGKARLAVIERHGKNGNAASAWTAGTGLRHGALAATIAHDHHNLIVLGDSPADMRRAAEHLAAIGGGLVVVLNGEILAELALPVGGLMSERGAGEVAHALQRVSEAARATGTTLADPFATLSFLALPVIPALKLTDRGLIAMG